MASKKHFSITLNSFGLQDYTDMPGRDGVAYDVIITFKQEPVVRLHNDGCGGQTYLTRLINQTSDKFVYVLNTARGTLARILNTAHVSNGRNCINLETVFSNVATDTTECFEALFELLYEINTSISSALGRKSAYGMVINCERSSFLAKATQAPYVSNGTTVFITAQQQCDNSTNWYNVLRRNNLHPVWFVYTEAGKRTYKLGVDDICRGIEGATCIDCLAYCTEAT